MLYTIKHFEIWSVDMSTDVSHGDDIIKSKLWTMTLSSIFEKETLAFSGRCQNAFGSLGHLPVCQNLLSSIEALCLLELIPIIISP